MARVTNLIRAEKFFRLFKAARAPRSYLFDMSTAYQYEKASYYHLFLAAEAGELYVE